MQSLSKVQKVSSWEKWNQSGIRNSLVASHRRHSRVIFNFNFISCIQELNLSSSKNFSKVVSSICDKIKDSYSLTTLDLSHNNLDAISCKHLGFLIRTTHNLQHLDLSYCGIRGHSARIILNSLMLNQTLRYLNLSWNAFYSSDYEFGSKLARII